MEYGETPKPPKPPRELEKLNMADYQKAIQWLKQHLLKRGVKLGSVVLDPYVEVWRLYDVDGSIITSLEHDVMERLLDVLTKIDAYAERCKVEAFDEMMWEKRLLDENED